MKARTLAALIVALLALALAACGDDDDDNGGGGAGELDTIRSGTLTVGSDIPFRPFEFGRAPDYDGFDIELAREIANRLDLQLEIRDTPFDTIFRDLAQGRFDMVASATTITDEREQTVDFSDPYYLADQALLVQEGGDIRAVEDLAGATVGAQDGTTGADYADEETDAENVRTFEAYDDAFNALVAGQIDAVIADLPAARDAVEQKEGLEIAVELVTRELYGLAFQQDADPLREEVNRVLGEMKQDGTYRRIFRKWFEEEPPEDVLNATHEPS